MTNADLIEIFSSIQGEGPYLGFRQLFIRFARCNLACQYCDTPFAPVQNCRVETGPGSETFALFDNPVSLTTIENIVREWTSLRPGLHHSISLTGGEPLLHVSALASWLPVLRQYLPIYLETNGTLSDNLNAVLPWIDIISMDFKLPSTSGQGDLWRQHRIFLRRAQSKQVFVKIVFDRQTPHSEIIQAAELLVSEAPDAELILQPRTTAKGVELSTQDLLSAQQVASAVHARTRVIPQTHNFLGVL